MESAESQGSGAPGPPPTMSRRRGGDISQKKPAAISNRPRCLNAVLASAKHKETMNMRFKDRNLNKRFLSTMFMPSIDTEAVDALLEEPLDLNEFADDVQYIEAEKRAKIVAADIKEMEKQKMDDTLYLNKDGADKVAADKLPLTRHAITSADTRLDPASPLKAGMNLPKFGKRSSGGLLTETTIGTLGSIDSYLHLREDDTIVTLPSLSKGNSNLPITGTQASRYFGKDARDSFFDQYRAMTKTHHTFSQGIMRKDRETGKWHRAQLNELGAAQSPRKDGKEGRRNILFPLEGKVGEGVREDKEDKAEEGLGTSRSVNSGNSGDQDSVPPLRDQMSWAADKTIYEKCKADIDYELLCGPQYVNFGDFFEAKIGDTAGTAGTAVGDGRYPDDDDLSREYSPTALQLHLESLHLPSLETNQFGSVIGDSIGGTATEMAASDVPVTPRSSFIAACLNKGLPPLPSLIMRKILTTKIDLCHFGIGDDMGCALAECLYLLPTIESINLCDNNLTDESLVALITAISGIEGMQELNLSRNKIDEKASEALADYLKDPECPLYRLVLDASDVDDDECSNFVSCLETNKNLREVDLSNNLLGVNESIPGARTGGAALAEYLSSAGCRLEYLKLAWNGVRADTGMVFAAALGSNKTLTYLDLAYNGLGSAAGEILGDSIIDNKHLKTLILDNNNIGSTACVTICIGICQNFAIKKVSMDENPIGEAGAQAVMQVPTLIGNRVELSVANCNTVIRDSSCWYDQASPCRNYSLDLSVPFERAVAFSVLQVVASHSSYIVVGSSFSADTTNKEKANAEKSFGRAEEIQLVQSVAKDKEDYFDEEQIAIVSGLRTLQKAASNTEEGKKLFEEADLDGGGDLDREELRIVMERLGIASDPEKMQDIFAIFDLDGTGVMTMEEFLDVLKAQAREAASRVKEMTEYPVLALSHSKSKKYVPPKEGRLNLTVVDGFTEKEHFSVMTSSDQTNALQMAMRMGDSSLITEAIRSTKIRFTEAESLFKKMYKETGNMAASIAKLLPVMKSGAEAKQLVSKVTGDDRSKVGQIKQILGIAAKTIFGMYNGYYILDLSNEYHRTCLSKLFEQSQRFNSKRAMECWLGYGLMGDTSQHQNWNSFRNELLNKTPIEVSPEKFTPMPKSGILEFDFFGCQQPSPFDVAIGDHKFCNVLSNLYIIKCPEENEEVEDLLMEHQNEILYYPDAKVQPDWSKERKIKALRQEGGKSVYECPREKSLEFGLACDEFYERLSERKSQMKEYMLKEVIDVNLNGEDEEEEETTTIGSSSRRTSRASSPGASPYASPVAMNRKTLELTKIEEKVEENQTIAQAQAEAKAEIDGIDHTETQQQTDLQEDISIMSFESVEVTKDKRQQAIEAVKERLQLLLEHPKVSDAAKTSRFIEIVEETFSHIWLDCRQVAILLEKVPYSDTPQSEIFGSYKVGLAIALFGRIVDPHNIEIVLRLFDAHDTAAFYCRVGFLNLFNPSKPEGTLECNMSRFEEVQIAKMLIYLSIVEPGGNMPQPMFKWKRHLDPTPGFEITSPWATLEGLPKYGHLGITFYSGEGKELQGCKVHVQARRALMQMCLVDENLTDKDPLSAADADTGIESKHTAAKFLNDSQAARSYFNDYLLPGCLDNSAVHGSPQGSPKQKSRKKAQ